MLYSNISYETINLFLTLQAYFFLLFNRTIEELK